MKPAAKPHTHPYSEAGMFSLDLNLSIHTNLEDVSYIRQDIHIALIPSHSATLCAMCYLCTVFGR